MAAFLKGTDPRNARALLAVTVLLLVVVAGMAGHPARGAVTAALASLCALPAVLVGSRGTRWVGAVLLALSLAITVILLPAFFGKP